MNKLLAGSLVMIVGSNVTNFLNYIYHLILGRMLGPASYGELAALISLIGLLGMIPLSLGLVVTKFISASKTEAQIKNLATWFDKRVLFLALVILTTITLSSSYISKFLNIKDTFLIIIVGVSFLFLLPSTFNRALLQGLLKFRQFVISVLFENFSKLALAIILVVIGFGVTGAMMGLLIGIFFGWLISRHFIRGYLVKKAITKPKIKPIFVYSVPVIFQFLTITSLYSSDLILVKHFFSSHEAGIYAALSTLGRIIYFGAGPITSVMFPIISAKQSQGQNYKKVFILSLLMTVVLTLVVLLIYIFLPDLSIQILYGSKYLEAKSLLALFGIFSTLLTIANLLTNYYLSLGKVKVVILPIIAAISQIFGIVFYHSSLMEVITVSIIVTTLLIIFLFVYFGYENYLESKFTVRNSSGIQTGEDNNKGSKKNKKRLG